MIRFKYVGTIGDLFVYGKDAHYVIKGDIVEVSENSAPGYRASNDYEEIIEKTIKVKKTTKKVKK